MIKALLDTLAATASNDDAKLEKAVLKLEKSIQKHDEREGKLPNPEALTTPAPAILEGKGRTIEGSMISRLNAVKHGILSEVLPDFEKDAYALHVANVFEDYNPQNYLETRLCERIASSLWRLQRLERHETAIVARDTATAIKAVRDEKEPVSYLNPHSEQIHAEDIPHQLESTQKACEMMRRGVDSMRLENGEALSVWLWAFWELADKTLSKWRKAERTLEKALKTAGCTDEWTDPEAHPYLTFEMVHPAITALGQCIQGWLNVGGVLEPGEWQWFQDRLEVRVNWLTTELTRIQNLETHAAALASIPHERNTDKIAKYEAHLERGLYKALHELEALQDRRNGKNAPLARVEVHSSD